MHKIKLRACTPKWTYPPPRVRTCSGNGSTGGAPVYLGSTEQYFSHYLILQVLFFLMCYEYYSSSRDDLATAPSVQSTSLRLLVHIATLLPWVKVLRDFLRIRTEAKPEDQLSANTTSSNSTSYPLHR